MEGIAPGVVVAGGVAALLLLNGGQGKNAAQSDLPVAQAATTTTAASPQPSEPSIFQALETQRKGLESRQPTSPQSIQQSTLTPGSIDTVEVSLAERTATVYKDGKPVKTYPVGVGKPSTPTPRGSFQIDDMEENPTYLSPSGETIPPGPDNPLGNRWARFTSSQEGEYGFHGGDINSGSMGCVRLQNGDLQEFYSLVRKGTRVEVY